MYDEAVTASDHRPPVSSGAPSARLPLVVYVLAVGTFLMLTSEFVVAGILPEIAGDLQVSLARAGSLITAFALGMILGAPLMAMLTMRLSKRLTLILALVVFVVGHVAVALASDFAVLMAARFVTAFAAGAFWAVSAVVAMQPLARPGAPGRWVSWVPAAQWPPCSGCRWARSSRRSSVGGARSGLSPSQPCWPPSSSPVWFHATALPPTRQRSVPSWRASGPFDCGSCWPLVS